MLYVMILYKHKVSVPRVYDLKKFKKHNLINLSKLLKMELKFLVFNLNIEKCNSYAKWGYILWMNKYIMIDYN